MKRIVELIIKAAQTHATRCEQAGTIFSQRIKTGSSSEPLNKLVDKHRMARMANMAKLAKKEKEESRKGGVYVCDARVPVLTVSRAFDTVFLADGVALRRCHRQAPNGTRQSTCAQRDLKEEVGEAEDSKKARRCRHVHRHSRGTRVLCVPHCASCH